MLFLATWCNDCRARLSQCRTADPSARLTSLAVPERGTPAGPETASKHSEKGIKKPRRKTGFPAGQGHQ
jgi:hypothetical protein